MAHIVDKYGEFVTELVPDGFGFYELPPMFNFDNIAIGDVYTVVSDDYDEEDDNE